jgi:trehalose 6-phosphate phosphatase
MKELFSHAGQQALREFVRGGLLCLFDFDGTLVPLEPHPDKVNVPSAVLDRLQRLQQRAPVGIVTGRGLQDMRRMLSFEPDYLIGNHGIEGLPGWERRVGQFEAVCEGWQQQLAQPLSAFGSEVWIEYKRYSLSVHFLHAPDPEQVSQQLSQLFSRLQPVPRIIAGKSVFNLLPPGASDKGKAVCELMALTGASHALYVGDDVTDEHVFALGRDDLLTIRVGPGKDSAAVFWIPDHEAIVKLMDLLIEYLPSSSDRASGVRSGAL